MEKFNKSKYDMDIICFTIISNMSVILINYFEGKISNNTAREQFCRLLDIIKHGIIKGDGT